MTCRFRPLGNRVVAKRVKATDQTTASGIIIPVDVSKPYFYAEAVAVGRGLISQHGDLIEPETKVGDTVLLFNSPAFILPKEDAPELKDNEEYIIFAENDAVTIVNKKD
jgi:co-chaperonin GroES (HSP10)